MAQKIADPIASIPDFGHIPGMPSRKSKPDPSRDALRAVEAATGSKPVKGETLLRARKLKAQLREAKAKQRP